MILYAEKEQCCGCAACVSICPVHALTMEADDEGFVYPFVNTDMCVHCKKCYSVCAFSHDQTSVDEHVFTVGQYKSSIPYAVKHRDDSVRIKSRSGGVFSALTDWILDQAGVVYGCALTTDLNAVHIRADNRNDRDRMRGSKYIQSDISDSFLEIINDLRSSRIVCFSGTSCQIASLRRFLSTALTGSESKLKNNLYCIDILCHGVPSSKILHSYIAYLEKRFHSRCRDINFRDKRHFGWKEHIEAYRMTGPIFRWTYYGEVYKKLYYAHHILRPSCYRCPYKSVIHPGDITIGDYWGIDKAAPGFNDDKGVSLVLINNDRGKTWFESIEKQVDMKNTNLADSMQPALQYPFLRPKDRDLFWEKYNSEGIKGILSEYVCDYGVKKIKNRIKILLLRYGRRY